MNASQTVMTLNAEGRLNEESATNTPGRRFTILSWALQLACAAILFQTLFFKFTAAEESVYIFKALGMEPWGRIGSGLAELFACVLLLIPRTVPVGALLALGVIGGAIVSHLTRLGIVVKNDGGLLFALALIVFAGCLTVLIIRRRQFLAFVRIVVQSRGAHVSS
ncbi:MAG: hypothetical protein CHACPFDD_02091 [Phycisphaerae bacterium]|nr:hypothetical protein [Phycisphaerae bacterium]